MKFWGCHDRPEPKLTNLKAGLGMLRQEYVAAFVLALFVAGVSWLVGRWLEPRLIRAESRRTW